MSIIKSERGCYLESEMKVQPTREILNIVKFVLTLANFETNVISALSQKSAKEQEIIACVIFYTMGAENAVVNFLQAKQGAPDPAGFKSFL